MDNTIEIYSLKALAEREEVRHDSLNHVVLRFKRGEIQTWRGYKFYGIEGKCWFAIRKEIPITFYS
jgi:hypothetical protein